MRAADHGEPATGPIVVGHTAGALRPLIIAADFEHALHDRGVIDGAVIWSRSEGRVPMFPSTDPTGGSAWSALGRRVVASPASARGGTSLRPRTFLEQERRRGRRAATVLTKGMQ